MQNLFLFFLKNSTVISLHEATTTASLTFRENTLARLAPIVVSHIIVMQFLNKNISPSARALLPFSPRRRRTPVHLLWLDEAFLQARHFYLAGPRWISACQAAEQMKCFCCYGQWREWQWIWKCADDSTRCSTSSEFRRGSFHQIPPRDGPPFPTPSQGFPWCWQGFHLRDDVKLCCQGHWVQCASGTLTGCDFQTTPRFHLFLFFPSGPSTTFGSHKYKDVEEVIGLKCPNVPVMTLR